MNRLIVLSILASVGSLLMVVGAYIWLDRRRLAREQAMRARLSELSEFTPGSAVEILRRDAPSKSVIDRILSNRELAATLAQEVGRSGLGWTPGRVVGYSLGGFVLGVLTGILTDLPTGVAVAAVGTAAPYVYVLRKKKEREGKIEEQLPEAVDMLVNSLRAGYSLPAAMNFVGGELPAPVGEEFTRFFDEQRLGMDARQALDNLQARLNTLDARMFVLAILIQRETGGNLSEILGSIASVIRERMNFREQVKVLTAEANMSAVILSLLPIAMYVLMRFLNPSYVAQLTTTDTGKLMLLYAGVSISIGYVVLKRIAKVEI